MEQKQVFRQMLDFNKAAFSNAFNAMVMVQDQNEVLATSLLNQATWLPDEGKKAIREWIDTLKKGRDEYKKNVDKAFKNLESYL